MPTITYYKKDLLNLIGKEMPDEQLEEVINLVKPNVEKMTKDEVTVEHTPDRPDLFGIEGLARAVRHYLYIDKKIKRPAIKKSGLTVKAEKIAQRPYIACAVVRKVRMDDYFIRSLMNIQEVLHETIGRKRKKVAIGVHDLDMIKFPVSYTAVKPSTKMVPLESVEEMSLAEVLQKTSKGREYGLILDSSKTWPVFEDKGGIFSFPPIINSDRTKVTEKTKNLFVELTGTDRQAVSNTLNILVHNFSERGFAIESVEISGGKKETTPIMEERTVELDLADVNRVTGLGIKGKEVVDLLGRMDYESAAKADMVSVTVPYYRADILHPIDIIEDITIAYGYNNFKPELPEVGTVGRPHELEKLTSRVRNLLTGLGFQEITRYILSNDDRQFSRMHTEKESIVEIENPVSAEYTCLRKYLLPGFLEFLASNMHQDYPQKVFEVGDVVVLDGKSETGARNVRKLCCAISDTRVSYEDIASILDSFMRNMGITYMMRAKVHPSFIEGRCAEIVVDGGVIGVIGEVSPMVLSNWKMEMPVVAFEIEVRQK